MTKPLPYPPIWADEATMAALLCLGESTFRSYVSRGLIPEGVRVGSQRRWKVKEIMDGNDKSFVYFIHCQGRIKIGKAKNPKRRLIDLQVHCPYRAAIVLLEPGGFLQEREYHQRFASLRRQGEWFDLSGELADFLWSKGAKL